jgi:hypothetical protein
MATPTTLPATFTSGQILTAAQMNDLRGAFRVLQVVQGTTQTQVVTTSTSYVTSGLSATITPSSTSSLILVSCSGTFSATFGTEGFATIFRGTVAGTNLGPANGFNTIYVTGTTGVQNLVASASYLDNPATTSAQTYTLGIKKNGSGSVYFSTINTLSTMTLMEISA